MIEPQRTSFHGDQSRVGNQPRAAPEDPEVVAAIREAERIVQEARSSVCPRRVGPNVLGLRSMETVKAPKVVER